MLVLKRKPTKQIEAISGESSGFRPDDSAAGWLAAVPRCHASALCFEHGSSGLVSRNALISGLKNQEHHLALPPGLTNA